MNQAGLATTDRAGSTPRPSANRVPDGPVPETPTQCTRNAVESLISGAHERLDQIVGMLGPVLKPGVLRDAPEAGKPPVVTSHHEWLLDRAGSLQVLVDRLDELIERIEV